MSNSVKEINQYRVFIAFFLVPLVLVFFLSELKDLVSTSSQGDTKGNFIAFVGAIYLIMMWLFGWMIPFYLHRKNNNGITAYIFTSMGFAFVFSIFFPPILILTIPLSIVSAILIWLFIWL